MEHEMMVILRNKYKILDGTMKINGAVIKLLFFF